MAAGWGSCYCVKNTQKCEFLHCNLQDLRIHQGCLMRELTVFLPAGNVDVEYDEDEERDEEEDGDDDDEVELGPPVVHLTYTG